MGINQNYFYARVRWKIGKARHCRALLCVAVNLLKTRIASHCIMLAKARWHEMSKIKFIRIKKVFHGASLSAFYLFGILAHHKSIEQLWPRSSKMNSIECFLLHCRCSREKYKISDGYEMQFSSESNFTIDEMRKVFLQWKLNEIKLL